MISVHMIARMFETRQFDRLLGALAGNGLALPLPVRAVLLQSPVGVIALALRRLAELTYGPTEAARAMLGELLEAQAADGAFERCPVATAAAAAALRQLADQPAGYDPEVGLAHERAIAALAGMQRDDGLFATGDDRTVDDRETTSAFVLYLLAGDEPFRQAVRMHDLMNWFDERAAERRLGDDASGLWRMARADSAPRRETSTAVAAIAA